MPSRRRQDGYLWIGAEKGLVRFDGMTFTLLSPTVPGQSAIRTVLGLVADADGSLWVRVAGPTLLRYQRRRVRIDHVRLGVA